ncbi:pentatricopeptide repeat-containing protein [Canna indica]|uniref:Pentatricopeptide repeat-containing protein n=1 Tax=Canna indica TaxID=4628 RepID=A0AAQ3JP33_9LILI|nr:pentatricopeptide repeat-containing protein [Canna indica]
MAAMLASAPPQPLPKTTLPLPPPSSTRLPTHLRRSGDRPYRRRHIHSAPASPADWPLEQRIRESLAILDLMEAQAITPDPELLAAILKSCADARALRLGRVVQDKAARASLQTHPLVVNSLILLYGKCGQLGIARSLFDEMTDRDVVSWTTIISVYHHAGFPHDALDLYRSMIADGEVRPNAFTYTVALNCCASVQDFELGARIHEDLVKDGCDIDEFIFVALIDMYAKCERVDDTRKVFDRLSNPSVQACTAMIEGYNGNGEAKKAMDVMRRMFQTGVSSKAATKLGFASMIRSCTMELALRQGQEIHGQIIKFGHEPGLKALIALIELYEKSDKMFAAKYIFDSFAFKNLDLWVTMVSGFARNKLYIDVLKLYVEMVSLDIRLNPLVVSLAIKACIEMSCLEEGKQIHATVAKASHLLDETVISSLVDLYKSCGEYQEAQQLTKKA